MTTSAPGPDAEPGDEFVRTGLRALSDDYPDRMPAAVAQRLDDVLAGLPDLTAPETPTPVATPPRRPWWRRFAPVVASSAAAVVLFGVGLLIVQPWNTDTPASTSADSGEANGREATGESAQQAPGEDDSPVGPNSFDADYPVTYSGTDYSADGLTQASGSDKSGEQSELDPSLDPLATDTARRNGCLATVLGTYPGVVESVDFGSVEGDPAMLAVVTSGDSGTVVAVGADCGTTTMDRLGSQQL